MQQREGEQIVAQAEAQEKQSEQFQKSTHIAAAVVCKRYTAAHVKLSKRAAFRFCQVHAEPVPTIFVRKFAYTKAEQYAESALSKHLQCQVHQSLHMQTA